VFSGGSAGMIEKLFQCDSDDVMYIGLVLSLLVVGFHALSPLVCPHPPHPSSPSRTHALPPQTLTSLVSFTHSPFFPFALAAGDHIFTDVNVAKGYMRWRTALIVRELEDEVGREGGRPFGREGRMERGRRVGRRTRRGSCPHRLGAARPGEPLAHCLLVRMTRSVGMEGVGYGPAARHTRMKVFPSSLFPPPPPQLPSPGDRLRPYAGGPRSTALPYPMQGHGRRGGQGAESGLSASFRNRRMQRRPSTSIWPHITPMDPSWTHKPPF
jgi:hypothetical protein